MAETRYIIVGDVVRPHGIKGELCIDSHADSPSYFTRGATVRLAPKNALHKGRNFVVAAVREHKGRLLVTFDGVPDRNMAETLRGLAVCVRPEDVPPPDPDEVFLHELLGLRVRLVNAAPTDPDLGTLEDIQDAGGAELWHIRDAQNREILFPAADELVPEIDLDAGIVVIDPPPGLLELYQGSGESEGEAE